MIIFLTSHLKIILQAGMAGEDAPTAVFPALVGRPRHQVRTLVLSRVRWHH